MERTNALTVGLLITAVTWFLFSFHELFKAVVNINEYLYFPGQVAVWVMATDYVGVVGLIARTVAGLVAIAAIVLCMKKRLSPSKTLSILQGILVAEAVYWLSLLPSGIWGVLPVQISGLGNPQSGLSFNISFLVETGLPCLVESTAIPFALFKLVSKLNTERHMKGAIKWTLITGAIYIFVFWLGNSANWIYTIFYDRGLSYITNYPENMLSFGLTLFGLLGLAIFAADFAFKSRGTETLESLNFRKAGAIVILLGLYFQWNYLTWIIFGNNQLWSAWYAWFLGHNMDLWLLAIPLIGLPLLFKHNTPQKQAHA